MKESVLFLILRSANLTKLTELKLGELGFERDVLVLQVVILLHEEHLERLLRHLIAGTADDTLSVGASGLLTHSPSTTSQRQCTAAVLDNFYSADTGALPPQATLFVSSHSRMSSCSSSASWIDDGLHVLFK